MPFPQVDTQKTTPALSNLDVFNNAQEIPKEEIVHVTGILG
jgi:hypothetical protein